MSDECRWSRCARYETPALCACALTIFPCCLPQPSDLIHATHKEFHWAKNGKTYALGHAAKYASYMEKNHPTATNMRSRGQKGSRHDQVFEAALAIFINRPGQVSFMEEECDSASLLVSACYINLSSLAMIALTRALGVLFLVLIEPWRFFSGTDSFGINGERGDDDDDDDLDPLVPVDDDGDDDESGASTGAWSPLNMSPIYDAIEAFLMACSVNGFHALKPENRDLFLDALQPCDKPQYRAWQQHQMNKNTRKPGGSLVAQRSEIEKRVFDPEDSSDAETDALCAEIIQVAAAHFLSGLYASRAADYFASKNGKYSVPNQTPEMIERMEGFLRTNDKGGESPIANFKYVYEMFVNIGWLAANAVATARATHTFNLAAVNAAARGSYKDGSSKNKPPVSDGAFAALGKKSTAAQDALIRAGRRQHGTAKREMKRSMTAQKERWEELAEIARTKSLDQVKAKFKNATVYYSKWDSLYKSIKSTSDLNQAVKAIPAQGRKVEFLKDFCKVGEHGLGFVEKGHVEHKPFSAKSDPNVGTITDLLGYCTGSLLPAIRGNLADIPDEAPLPPIPVRHVSTLGTSSKQRTELHAARVEKAAAKRLEWANEIAREAAAPRRARAGGASAPQMPDPATLLDSRIEMIMRCEIPTPDGPVVDLYLCPGTVKRVVCGGKLKVGRKTYTHEWVYVE